MRGWSCAIAATLVAALGGCDLAPAYDPPDELLPASWTGQSPWQIARPQDRIVRGPWWVKYGNPTLDALEARVPQNPDLLATREAFLQARDLAAEAASGLYPQIGSQYSMSTNRESAQQLFRSPTSTAPLHEASVQLDGTADWEIDIWDRIGNEAHAQKRLAQARAADLASLDLSLQGVLADTYLTLRGLDQERAIFDQAIGFYQLGVNITQARLADKIGNLLDLERAQSQLSAAEALQTDLTAQRALAEHAIADLIGVPANGFLIPPQGDTPLVLPLVPTGLPSALLQRRPDIAAAERTMAAANAQIGVARAAFYPNVSLSGVAGSVAQGFDLFSAPNAMWSLGSTIALPLFEGGLRRAELQFARSAYRQTRDGYRATVLGAIRQVEDELSLNDQLTREEAQDRVALAASGKTQQLALQLYQAGADNYLNVVIAEVANLQSGLGELGITIRVQQASVDLVRALGGGWDTGELPAEDKIRPFDPLVPLPLQKLD
jgi:NodT family efflux transporter outer membrane factor (OMF) lipoprotein